jgi:1-acyl-sn-glycerol-3-phosphate acyltransferase
MSPEPSLLWKTLRVPARIFTTTLFDIKVFGRHHVPGDGGVLMVANHQSYLDPVLVGVQIRRPLSYLAKAELFENPAFAWLIRSLHAFPLRQGEGDKGAMEQTIRELQSGKMLLIFPEGTRTPDGQIGPMQRGIALVIRRAKAPVLPVVIDGSYEAWKGRKIFRPWPIAVCYGPAMELAGLDSKTVLHVVGAQLRGMLDALREQRRRRDGVNPAELDETVCALWRSLMPTATAAAGGRASEKTPAAKSASIA